MKSLAASFSAGALFAVGLGVSGMTKPSKVTGFLDLLGAWHASLALVMAGAERRRRRGGAPVLVVRPAM